MDKEVYLDHAATTALSPRALEEMLPLFTARYGNPSSIHEPGVRAKKALEDSRARIARAIGAASSEIFFTSGGTESDNWVLEGVFRQKGGGHIVASAIEHNAVLKPLERLQEQGCRVTLLQPDALGRISPEALEEAICPDTILVSVMTANNVVGTLQDVSALARVARKHRVPFHTDAVQAVGQLPLSVRKLGADFLSLSAHKFGGPKGIGALYMRLPRRLPPLIDGGGQERSLRSGTENVPSVVGMAAALEEAVALLPETVPRLQAMRDRLIEGVRDIPGVFLTGDPAERLPGFASFLVDGLGHSVHLVNALNERGFCVSSGSACSASANTASHVLKAMGVEKELAAGALRITLGRENTMEEMEALLRCLHDLIPLLRAKKPAMFF